MSALMLRLSVGLYSRNSIVAVVAAQLSLMNWATTYIHITLLDLDLVSSFFLIKMNLLKHYPMNMLIIEGKVFFMLFTHII